MRTNGARTPSGPRLLLVSATPGRPAAPVDRALRDAAERRWPGVDVCVTDLGIPEAVLAGALPGAAPRGAGAEHPAPGSRRTPLARRVIGAVSGRRLAGAVDRVRPDLVLCADRIAAEGVEWLRRHRGLATPAALGEYDGGVLDVEASLRRLADAESDPGPRRLPAPDALFAHVNTEPVPQHVGTVLVFEPGPALTVERVADMLTAVPGVLGGLRPATVLRPARWVPRPDRTALSLVDLVTASPADSLTGTGPLPGGGDGGGEGDGGEGGHDTACGLEAEVDRFFSVPLRAETELGRVRIVTGLPGGREALLVKLHHALGDGMTVLQALLSETDDATVSWASRPSTPVRGTALDAVRTDPRRLARGLWTLMGAGRAPHSPTDGPVSVPQRHHELLRLPGRQVRASARAAGVSTAEWLLAAFAHALSEVFDAKGVLDDTEVLGGAGPGRTGDGARFRLMVPWSLRGTDSLRMAGNHTGAVSVDLPVGPMEPATRAARVAEALRTRTDSGVVEATNLVVHLLGALPPRLHVAAAKRVYRRDWFNAIGTVMPGPRRRVHWHGRELSAAYPVLALAPGTGLAWGALTWGEWITITVTGTHPLAPLVTDLATRLAPIATGAVPPRGREDT